MTAGNVVGIASWKTPKVHSVLIIRTYKHDEGFLGLDIRSPLGAELLAAVKSGTHANLVSRESEFVGAATHYYSSEVR